MTADEFHAQAAKRVSAPGAPSPRVRYEEPAPRVARITLARPEAANAQDYRMLSELNSAFDRAARDPEISVIILAADGRIFSSGHDLADLDPDLSGLPVVGNDANFHAEGAAGYMDREREFYLGYCRRWRDIPKPTIAQVQGRVIAGGLLLVWPMDLIVCSTEASFCDPVLAMGANGVEFFMHPYEVGVRTAKDMLFTGRTLSAAEAHARGMVQRIFAAETLEADTLALATQIARQPLFALANAKRSVNTALDAMGLNVTLEAAFALHHLGHSHWKQLHGELAAPGAYAATRDLIKMAPMAGVSVGRTP